MTIVHSDPRVAAVPVRDAGESLVRLDADFGPARTWVRQGRAEIDPDDRRRERAKVLCGAGLVKYPTEWWPWSYGDRCWAVMTDASAALYGPVLAEPVA